MLGHAPPSPPPPPRSLHRQQSRKRFSRAPTSMTLVAERNPQISPQRKEVKLPRSPQLSPGSVESIEEDDDIIEEDYSPPYRSRQSFPLKNLILGPQRPVSPIESGWFSETSETKLNSQIALFKEMRIRPPTRDMLKMIFPRPQAEQKRLHLPFSSQQNESRDEVLDQEIYRKLASLLNPQADSPFPILDDDIYDTDEDPQVVDGKIPDLLNVSKQLCRTETKNSGSDHDQIAEDDTLYSDFESDHGSLAYSDTCHDRSDQYLVP